MRPAQFLYVHIPFCKSICHYCHFYTARAAEAPDQAPFFRALSRDLDAQIDRLASQVDAVYFGGGTPGASPPELVGSLLARLGGRLHAGTEITLEANPTGVTPERVRSWHQAGVNRISLGVQSLDDPTLKRLGRAHSADQARRALETCAGVIPNLAADLLYAVPEQPECAPAEQALELLELGARHLSLYHLTLEKSHFLHRALPDDAFAWAQLRRAANALDAKGLLHYEVASFAVPGAESRNNRNYWTGGPYLALGPSAHGFDGKRERWSNVSDWREYVRRAEAGESTRAWTEQLTEEQRRMEVIFTSLRISEGLDLDAFVSEFGEDLRVSRAAWLRRWAHEGLTRSEGNRLVLTFSGRMLADEIARRLT